MASMGISRTTIGKILNHKDSGVIAVYDRHSYDEEKCVALEAWSDRLKEIISGASANSKVVQLKAS